MLFLVISTPRRSRMSPELVESRLGFRRWIRGLKKKVVAFYPREDRGAVVIFNLVSRNDLESVLRKWETFVRAKLDVYPLQEPAISKKNLEKLLRQYRQKADHREASKE